jgi:diacylglycerol kinase (ATP)
MRAAAILGLGCSPKNLKPFQSAPTPTCEVEWRIGMPASSDEADVILIFGGDGTIHRHLGQLVRLGLPVLVAPVGSGNDFARALGIPRVRDSLAAWQKFRSGAQNVSRIDLGIVTPLEQDGQASDPARKAALTSRYFCGVAGLGLDGEVARRANQLPRWLRGRGGYVLALLPTIFQFAPLRMRILTAARDAAANRNGSDRSTPWTACSDQPTMLAAFANAPLYGGGMKIAPQARMDDGLLDVCVVKDVDPFKLFCLFPTVYGGRHLQIREVEYFREARLRVETERPLEVYADGEFVCQTPVEFSVEREVLQVVIPRNG